MSLNLRNRLLNWLFTRALLNCCTPSTVMLLCPRCNMLNWLSSRTLVKCFTPASPISLMLRSRLLNWLFTRTLLNCCTPSSVMLFALMFKLLNWFFTITVLNCFTPSSPMLFQPRFKPLNWQFALANNFKISTQPNELMLFTDKSTCEICWTRSSIKWTTAVQSADVRWSSLKSTALKPISSNLLWTTEPDSLISWIHFTNVNVKSLSLRVGQQVTLRLFSEVLYIIIFNSSFSSVVLPRRLVNTSIDCSPSRPARNCKTSFHLPFLMRSATNVLNSSPTMVSVMCLAARNSCNVRWMKQYWAFSV